MNSRRYLCSELIRIRLLPGGIEEMVNLEEIWDAGAVLEAESAPGGSFGVELLRGDLRLAGRIIRVEAHEFGWRIEMEFTGHVRWSPSLFEPEHMLDVTTLGRS